MKRGKLRVGDNGYILFRCPGCRGVHGLRINGENRSGWGFNGDYNEPTFTPSILVNAPGQYHYADAPVCHSFITDGMIAFLEDSSHDLAGKTVPLPDMDDAV